MGSYKAPTKARFRLTLLTIGILAFQFPSQVLKASVCLGDESAEEYWIYFHGLDEKQIGQHERENREILSKLARELKIRVGVARSKEICKHGKLCWQHHSPTEIIKSVDEVKGSLAACQGRRRLNGLIGFSNGAYLVSKYFQLCHENLRVISVGGGGLLTSKKIDQRADWSQCGEIFFLMGKKDISLSAVKSKTQTLQSKSALSSRVFWRDFKGGHELPVDLLRAIMSRPSQIKK